MEQNRYFGGWAQLAENETPIVMAFPVPRCPAETAPRDHGARNWVPTISKLPAIVTSLARRWMGPIPGALAGHSRPILQVLTPGPKL